MSKEAKFKIGDQVLFKKSSYDMRESTVIAVVTQRREMFKETEINYCYKVRPNGFWGRVEWVNEDQIMGHLDKE